MKLASAQGMKPIRERLREYERRTFQTKPALGWQMIQRARKRGIPFQAVLMDSLFGRNEALRQRLAQVHLDYYGDVPANTQVNLQRLSIVYPLTQKRQAPSKNPVAAGAEPVEVQAVGQQATLDCETISSRTCSRYFSEFYSLLRNSR